MEANSNVILDSNICIYRTLAVVEPKIYYDLLHKTQRYINDITNSPKNCRIIVTDTVKKELLDENDKSYIIIRSIKDFCVRKLSWSPYGYKIQKIIRNAQKSIKKFVDKKSIHLLISDFKVNYGSELPAINKFYLKYPKKLKQITQNKIRFLSQQEKACKLANRPQNLPEESDRKILAEAINIKKRLDDQETYILTNDSDFTEFCEEIKSKFGVNIAKMS